MTCLARPLTGRCASGKSGSGRMWVGAADSGSWEIASHRITGIQRSRQQHDCVLFATALPSIVSKPATPFHLTAFAGDRLVCQAWTRGAVYASGRWREAGLIASKKKIGVGRESGDGIGERVHVHSWRDNDSALLSTSVVRAIRFIPWPNAALRASSLN